MSFNFGLQNLTVKQVTKREKYYRQLTTAEDNFSYALWQNNVLGVYVHYVDVKTTENWQLTPLGEEIMDLMDFFPDRKKCVFICLQRDNVAWEDNLHFIEVLERCALDGDQENIPTLVTCPNCQEQIVCISKTTSLGYPKNLHGRCYLCDNPQSTQHDSSDNSPLMEGLYRQLGRPYHLQPIANEVVTSSDED